MVTGLILISFFVSGVSALVYQVCWQRSLYGIIGVDMDSITIVVSVFMLGIGFGGMIGGWIADKYSAIRLKIYISVELSIAAYGAATVITLPLIDYYLAAAGGGIGVSSAISFLFLVIPTTLMGMTLPILTLLINESKENIGVSVGMLYFVNTMGAAIGAAIVPFVMFPALTISHSILVAASGNVFVSLLALTAVWLSPRVEN